MKKSGRVLVLEPSSESLASRLLSIFDDESWKYGLAEKAIVSSGLAVAYSGSATTRWIFDDFNEMASYIFDFFDMAPDTAKEKIMTPLVGDRRRENPLSLARTLHEIFSAIGQNESKLYC